MASVALLSVSECSHSFRDCQASAACTLRTPHRSLRVATPSARPWVHRGMGSPHRSCRLLLPTANPGGNLVSQCHIGRCPLLLERIPCRRREARHRPCRRHLERRRVLLLFQFRLPGHPGLRLPASERRQFISPAALALLRLAGPPDGDDFGPRLRKCCLSSPAGSLLPVPANALVDRALSEHRNLPGEGLFLCALSVCLSCHGSNISRRDALSSSGCVRRFSL